MRHKSLEFLLLTAVVMVALMMAAGSIQAAENVPTEKNFDQKDGVLARARAIEDIEYKIMVQRATQAAIYYMPAVVNDDFKQIFQH